MNDPRNVLDEFKGKSHEAIVAALDARGVNLEIAIENLERDFNMGTIVRSANAFGVRWVHVVGRKQWNKRGAMMTDKYLQVQHHETADEFVSAMQRSDKTLVALENNLSVTPPFRKDVPFGVLSEAKLPEKCVLIFGSEGGGISEELLSKVDRIVSIEQLGSTRSLNVGVAAGIAMYEWLRQSRQEKFAK